MNKQKPKTERRTEWVIVYATAHWNRGVVLQSIVADHALEEFKALCAENHGWILVCRQALRKDGQPQTLTKKEVRQALKARGLLTPERAKYLEAVGTLKADPSKPI